MDAAQIPTKTPTIWASTPDAGTIRTVPVAPPPQLGAASFQKGFPIATFTSNLLGGSDPFGQDFQYILNVLNAWVQWQQAGGPVEFDGTFSAAIGGYPAGAILQSSVTAGLLWQSNIDNNTVNPDVTPTNWTEIGGGVTLAGDVSGPSGTNVIGAGKVGTANLAARAVTNAKMADMNSATLKGNNGGAPAAPLDLTVNQVLAMLGISITGLLNPTGNLNIGIPGVGTIIFQWGAYLATLGVEEQVNVPLTTPFPNAVLWYIGIGINNSNSGFQDLWVQNVQNQVGPPNLGLLPFFLQATSPSPGHLDGIQWFAIGY